MIVFLSTQLVGLSRLGVVLSKGLSPCLVFALYSTLNAIPKNSLDRLNRALDSKSTSRSKIDNG